MQKIAEKTGKIAENHGREVETEVDFTQWSVKNIEKKRRSRCCRENLWGSFFVWFWFRERFEAQNERERERRETLN